MTALTVEAVQQATRELLEEYGEDYVYDTDENDDYDGCRYGPTENADGCLIGLIVKKLDPPRYEALIASENCDRVPIEFEGLTPWGDPLYNNAIIDADPDFRIQMRLAQSRQDGGSTWGRAAEAILGYKG